MIFENEEARIPSMLEVYMPMFVSAILIAAFIFLCYKFSVYAGGYDIDFLSWLQDIIYTGIEDFYPILLIILLIILVPGIITFSRIKQRNKRLFNNQQFNQLIYINILQGRIYFSFKNSDSDFDCDYSDIKDITLIIETDRNYSSSYIRYRRRRYHHSFLGGRVKNLLYNGISTDLTTPRGVHYYISKLNVNINLNNGETYTLQLKVPAIEYKILYDFLDCIRGIENFSYKYTGAGEMKDITKQINKHLGR